MLAESQKNGTSCRLWYGNIVRCLEKHLLALIKIIMFKCRSPARIFTLERYNKLNHVG